MWRAIEFEVPVDTSTFSAVQLHPGVAASLTWSALARWLRAHLVSMPTLIAKESTGLVVTGFHLEYHDAVSFFDVDAFTVRAGLRIMRRGERGQLDLRFFTDRHDIATARLIVVPVSIEDPISLAATPAGLSEDLLARLEPGYVESTSPERIVPVRLAAVETSGHLIAEATMPFTIDRHRTEVAEQWSFAAVPPLAAAAREDLALNDHSSARTSLLRCLSSPLSGFDVEFGRPFFSFERGNVVTRAYTVGDRLGLVHRFTSEDGTTLHATAVEVL